MPMGRNRLLEQLSIGERARLAPSLEPIALVPGEILTQPGEPVTAAIFPTSGLVALEVPLADGAGAAVALAAGESVIGMGAFLGAPQALFRARVVVAGSALRLALDVIVRERQSGGTLDRLAAVYFQALTGDMAQTAVCNRHHALHQQLGRWLLMAFDRYPSATLRLTHEQLAQLLGVRREGVTEAARRLQQAGVIQCGRGRIELCNRQGLQALACSCYRLLPAA